MMGIIRINDLSFDKLFTLANFSVDKVVVIVGREFRIFVIGFERVKVLN